MEEHCRCTRHTKISTGFSRPTNSDSFGGDSSSDRQTNTPDPLGAATLGPLGVPGYAGGFAGGFASPCDSRMYPLACARVSFASARVKAERSRARQK
jgi:hypothetical protein